ncbi:hypothetical protein ACHQM5_030522 [Ranunculus cassubicifolius]
MGLEIPQDLLEFWPITPIRTVLLARTITSSPITPIDNVNTNDPVEGIISNGGFSDNVEEDENSCHTPKSASQLLKTPLICPPAPRKPRPLKRKSAVLSSQLVFHVPRDLNSVFTTLSNPSKKIKVG